jgi:hypothetical protein
MIFWQTKPKKIRKRSFWWTKFQSITRKRSILALSIFTAWLAVLMLWFWWYKKTIWSPTHIIEKVVFAPESVNAIRDITLYTNIVTYLKGKNTILLNWFWKNELNTFLSTNHPLIDRLEYKETAANTVFVTLFFHEPSIVWQTPSHYFISFNEDLYQVNTDSVLIQWRIPLQLPSFSSGRNDINGIYRTMSESDLKQTLSNLLWTLWTGNINEIIYQPGWKRLFVTYKWKRVYLNLNKNIPAQIESLLALEQNRVWFPDARTIDIGSREEVIVK